jgi:probable O-glycosylation ligase (exosortase A-associated)
MRGALVLIIIFGSLPYCLSQPWIGVLMFSWISYMNPHRYAWGPAREFPVAMVVALATLIGLVLTRDKSPMPKDKTVVLMVTLWATFIFSTLFAFNEVEAFPHFIQVSKIWLMVLVSTVLINSPRKLRYLLLVIAISLGLIGIKGGLWALATGGGQRVYGPDGTFIGDNNNIALAFNMGLPLMFYLAKDEANFWLKSFLRVAFGFTIIGIIFTYSRGGFLALAVVGVLLMFKARYKSIAILTVGVALVIGMFLIPAKWTSRINTIETYDEDESVQGRFDAWKMSWKLALDRPLVGGGFDMFIPTVYARYSDDPTNARDVHSIYFEMLGEHGFIALIFFLLLIGGTITSTMGLKKLLRRNPQIQWAQYYPDMLQVSVIAYLVGGTFLGQAYFDMFYQLVAAVTITRRLVLQEVAAQVKSPARSVAPVQLRPAGYPVRLRSQT